MTTPDPERNATEPPLISLKRARQQAARELLKNFTDWFFVHGEGWPDLDDVDRYLQELDRG